MKETDPLALVLKRNSFYRRQFFLMLVTFVFSLVVIGLLIWQLTYLLKNSAPPVYFATDKVSRLIKIVPRDRADMTIDAVMQWAEEAVESAYSYDYINYRSQLQNAQKYFTTYGWRTYMSALQASNNLLALKERRMMIVAKVIDKPIIRAEGLLGGAYAWKFEMPILVTFWMPPYDEKSKFSNALTVTMTIQRQSELESYHGLGILQLIAGTVTKPQQPQEISAAATE